MEKKRKRTPEEIAESKAFRERVLANAERTRTLAEKALADLEPREGRPVRPRPPQHDARADQTSPAGRKAARDRALANAEWLRELAETAQADLDRRKQEREAAEQ